MKKRSVKVAPGFGGDSRSIAMLVQLAGNYDSKIYVARGDRKINAKSIMGMMTLNLKEGDEVEVLAEGTDEENAVQDVCAYLSEN